LIEEVQGNKKEGKEEKGIWGRGTINSKRLGNVRASRWESVLNRHIFLIPDKKGKK